MKRSFFLAATLYLLFLNFAIGQLSRTPEKIRQDSIEQEQFKKKYPELYQNRRKAISLIDGSTYIKGFNSLGIRIQQNHIVDSVNHNFHLGSKEKGIMPYNDIKVSDEIVSIELFNSNFFFNESRSHDTSSLDFIGNEHIRNGKIDAKYTNSKGWSSFLTSMGPTPLIDKKVDSIKLNTQTEDGYEIRISINGKLLFDWTSLQNFTKNTYHFAQRDRLTVKDSTIGFWFTGYGQGYQITTQKLKINDQLLIEIKNTKNGWMLDRFNITRTPIKPYWSQAETLASLKHKTKQAYANSVDLQKDNVQKRIDSIYFGRTQLKFASYNYPNFSSNSRLAFFFRKPSFDYPDSSLEYKLKVTGSTDTNWIKTGHLLILDEQPPGKFYELLVRYKNNTDDVWQMGFYIEQKWYQNIAYKSPTFLLISFIIFLSLLLLFFFIYRFRLIRIENKREKIKLELQGIRSRLNPHFIFNALSSIQGLINKNDIPNANLYLSEFSSLLRSSLQETDKEFSPIKTELVNIETYLKLEQLRFQFNYQINIDQQINTNTTEIPSMILQPIVENSIKHGIAGLYEKGHVSIQISTKEKDLLICIKDNGIGFDTSKKSNGLGLRLTKDRIQLLNQSLKGQQIQLTIQSNQNEGSSVFLSFKNWL
jgi:two-component sensor histidine kinase